jgi:hypothetical protein
MSVPQKETDRLFLSRSPCPGARQAFTSPNPSNESQLEQLDPVLPVGLYFGVVTQSFPGTYACNVKVREHDPAVPCVVATQGNGFLSATGVNHAWTPIEGSRVLVYRPDTKGRVGYILTALPPFVEQSDIKRERRWIIPSVDPEPSACFATEQCYYDPYDKPNMLDSLTANAGRPADVMPGQTGYFNEMGIGLYLGTVGAHLKATEHCGVDTFVMDNLLRIYSDQFQHYTALGEAHIYNDGGYQTYEWTGSPHMCEVFGYHDYNQQWLVKDTFDGKQVKNSVRKLKTEENCLHRRYQMYLGHICGLFGIFVANPDPTVNPNTYPSRNMDEGLFSLNVDTSGRLLVSSAGDIILERTDRIPMPKKLKEAWDPTGELVDITDPFQVKMPFDWMPEDDPRNRSLWLRDGIAWYKRLLYQRNDEAQADWFVPEEADLKIPRDEYEKIDKLLGLEYFSRMANKRSVICLGADGTITLRADGGAEIVLAGADIDINAPGDIRLKSGQNTVVLGRDVVLKGKDSVDITATDHDVRLKAERNLHLYSEKSILLQSNADGDGGVWDGVKGEEIYHAGVAIQAKKSRVFLHGKTVHLAGIGQIIMETLDTARGAVITATKRVLSLFKTMWNISENGGMQVIARQHYIVGKSVATIGQTSNVMIKGQKIAVIAPWADMKDSLYDTFRQTADPLVQLYLNDTAWLGSYTPPGREKLQFTYRTSRQMGTEDGQPLAPPARKFKVYEPFWAYMLDAGMGPSWLRGGTETWTERPVADTYAWPGEAWYTGGTPLRRLTDENNWMDYTKPVPRPDRVANGGTIEPASMSEYRILNG